MKLDLDSNDKSFVSKSVRFKMVTIVIIADETINKIVVIVIVCLIILLFY